MDFRKHCRSQLSRREFIATAVATVLATPQAGWATPKTYSLASYVDFLPLSDFKKNVGWVGFGPEFLKALLQRVQPGAKIEYMINVRWARAIASIEAGDLDFLYEMSFREERAEFTDYIGTTDVERAYLVTRNSAKLTPPETLDELANTGLRINLATDLSWNTKFDNRLKSDPDYASRFDMSDTLFPGGAISQEKLIESGQKYDYEVHISKLIALGRVDAAIFSHLNYQHTLDLGRQYVEKSGRGELLQAVPIKAFGEALTYLGASRKLDVGFRQELHNAYDELRADGTFDEVWAKWNGNREAPPHVKVRDI